MSFRHWVFTNYKLDFDYKKLIDDHKVKYIAYGLETCPKTKNLHHQGWLSFDKPKSSYKNVAALLNKSHVEAMKGTLQQNDKYCSKQTKGELVEFGKRPEQGKRVDLDGLKDAILSGETTVDEITINNPVAIHQYGRTLDRIQTVALRSKTRSWMTEGVWYHGPTGTGKSHTAFEGFDEATHYVKCLDDAWWDGYTGQEIVILNDFRGQISYSELLQLVDKYPHRVKQRCKEPVPFLAKKLIVTSSLHPRELYNKLKCEDSIDQLLRRFECVGLFDKFEPPAPDP